MIWGSALCANSMETQHHRWVYLKIDIHWLPYLLIHFHQLLQFTQNAQNTGIRKKWQRCWFVIMLLRLLLTACSAMWICFYPVGCRAVVVHGTEWVGPHQLLPLVCRGVRGEQCPLAGAQCCLERAPSGKRHSRNRGYVSLTVPISVVRLQWELVLWDHVNLWWDN